MLTPFRLHFLIIFGFSTLDKFIPAPNGPLDFGLKFNNSTWYDFLTEYLWSELNENEILYSCTVETIDYSDSNLVQVNATCGAFQADRDVVAVPLIVMQNGDIAFIPDLPEERRNVLQIVDTPPAVKVFLKFSEKFYPLLCSVQWQIMSLLGSMLPLFTTPDSLCACPIASCNKQ
jgi:Flavin containing amine oxidoreductase